MRQAIIALRNLERSPEGAPSTPDLVAIQQMERIEDVGVSGVIQAAVKLMSRAALDLTRRV